MKHFLFFFSFLPFPKKKPRNVFQSLSQAKNLFVEKMSSLCGQIMFSFFFLHLFLRFFFEQPPFFLFFLTSLLPSLFSLLVSLLWLVFAFDFLVKKNFGFSSPFFFSLFQFVVSSFSFLNTCLFLFHFFLPSGYKCF